MIKTLALERRIMPRAVAVAAMALLAGAGVQAWAWGAEPYAASATQVALLGAASPSTGQSVITPSRTGYRIAMTQEPSVNRVSFSKLCKIQVADESPVPLVRFAHLIDRAPWQDALLTNRS